MRPTRLGQGQGQNSLEAEDRTTWPKTRPMPSLHSQGQNFVKSVCANLNTNGIQLSPDDNILVDVNKKLSK